MKRATTAGTLLAALAMMVALGSPVEAQSRHNSISTRGRSRYGQVYRPAAHRRGDRDDEFRSSGHGYRGGGRIYGYFGSPFYYPSYGLGLYGMYGLYGPYYYAFGYPYYGYRTAPGPWASMRIEVKPKQARVYVDGYYAGTVDDFDGIFQRLDLTPGNHEIVVYLEGYRTIAQTMFVSPGNSYQIKQDMVPLAPGGAQEPPPQPLPQERAPGVNSPPAPPVG